MSTEKIAEAVEATRAYLRSGKTLDDFKREHGIKGKTDGDHVILDYDMITVKWTEPYGYVCRGLVLDAETQDVLGFGLGKFFNVGEGYAAEVDWNTAHVFEKLDGTMVKRWWSPRRQAWCMSTRFQLPDDIERNKVGDGGLTWGDVLRRCIDPIAHEMDQQKDETVVFEAMSPVNRIVVAHRAFKASVLARRCNRTYRERSIKGHPCAPQAFGFASQKETEAFAATLKGLESEGFVVVDANFRRVKIKGADYVRLHHLKDSATNSVKALILVHRRGEVDEVIAHFPEYEKALRQVGHLIEDFARRHEVAYEELRSIESQKDFAIAANSRGLENTGLLFSTRAGKADSVRDAMAKLDDNAFVRTFKPLCEKAGISVYEAAE